MKKFVCKVCGYVYEGEAAPAQCPICKAGSDKFEEMVEGMTWACEHEVGIAKDVSDEIKEGLRANFEGECTEVGMYLAMARVAHREDIRRSVFTGRRQLMKRLSMLLNLQSFLAK